jgi:hypothetical protein
MCACPFCQVLAEAGDDPDAVIKFLFLQCHLKSLMQSYTMPSHNLHSVLCIALTHYVLLVCQLQTGLLRLLGGTLDELTAVAAASRDPGPCFDRALFAIATLDTITDFLVSKSARSLQQGGSLATLLAAVPGVLDAVLKRAGQVLVPSLHRARPTPGAWVVDAAAVFDAICAVPRRGEGRLEEVTRRAVAAHMASYSVFSPLALEGSLANVSRRWAWLDRALMQVHTYSHTHTHTRTHTHTHTHTYAHTRTHMQIHTITP